MDNIQQRLKENQDITCLLRIKSLSSDQTSTSDK
jgi:hypothetical protein